MRTFYGAPDDPVEDLIDFSGETEPPEDGDELCEDHQAHYVWEDGRWQ